MSIQIKKKFIGSQVIDGSKILFLNDEAFKAKNSSGAEVSLFKLGTDNKLKFLEMPQLSSDPSAAEDVSRKGYVDAEVAAEQARAEAAEEILSDAIDALSSSGGAAVAGVQSELDATQVGAGLGTDGAYAAPVASNYLGSAVSLKDADSKLDAAIKAEETARIADVDAEQARAEAAEGALDGRLDSLEGIVTSSSVTLTGASPATITADDLEFAVTGTIDFGGKVLNSVSDGVAADDAATKGQVDAEASARSAADSALDARLDIIEGADTVEGSVAKAEKDAKDYTDAREIAITSAYQAYADAAEADAISSANSYTDAEIAALVASAPAVLDTLNELAQALGEDPNFATTVAGQIGDIQSELDATQTGAGLETDGTYVAPVGADYINVAVSLKDADSILDSNLAALSDALDSEVSRAEAAEAALEAEDLTLVKLDGSRSMTGPLYFANSGDWISLSNGSVRGLDPLYGTEPDDHASPKGYVDAEVSAEETRALAAEDALDARLDIIEGADTVEGSVAKAEKDAKDYADGLIAQEVIDRNSAISTAVSNLVDGAPALLDTLNELAAAINDDENFAATIAGQIGALDTRADALEAASVEFKPVEKFVLDATDISNGYITLSYLAIQHSLRVSVDRLAIHQGAANDYTVSTFGGVTRITFVNSLVTSGQEQLSVGDQVYVEGAKLAIVTV